MMVERALSSVCTSRVYHPEAEEGTRKAPHLALFHEEGTTQHCAVVVVVVQEKAAGVS